MDKSYHINETCIPGVSLEAVITLQAGIGQIHKKQSYPNHNTHSTEETFYSALKTQRHWKDDARTGDLEVEMGGNYKIVFLFVC